VASGRAGKELRTTHAEVIRPALAGKLSDIDHNTLPRSQ